jgi:hypothetical protein
MISFPTKTPPSCNVGGVLFFVKIHGIIKEKEYLGKGTLTFEEKGN